jgi:hypothetical protein
MHRVSIAAPHLSTRDREALIFIGEGYEVAQYQLQAAMFASRSPTVASRFVQRSVAKGLLVAERLNGSGINRLRLTPRAVDLLGDGSAGAEHLFAPRRAVAPKDLAHTLRVNDLRVLLAERTPPPTDVLPAWTLQRECSSAVVPDLLARWRGRESRTTLLLACEVDLGTERLTTVFCPKLVRLAASLAEVPAQKKAILVLTVGAKRIEHLQHFASEVRSGISLIIERLPRAFGPEGLLELRTRLLT